MLIERGQTMKITVHYPTSDKGREELAKRVATVHADTTIQYIDKLSCSNERKAALLDAIIAVKQKGNQTD